MKSRIRMKCLYLMMLVLSIMTFAGCGEKVTAESIMEQMKANTENLDSTEAKMVFGMEMNISESTEAINIDMDMKVSLDMDMQTTTDPEASHITMKVAVSATGMNIDMKMEMYQVAEGGETVTYSLAEDVWTRTVSEDIADTLDTDAMMELIETLDIEYTLGDRTEDVDGTEAYVLSTTITGKDIMSVMENLVSAMGEDFSMAEFDSLDLDIESLNAEIKYYVDKDKMLPLKVTVDFGDSLGKMFEGMGGTEGFEFKEAYLEIEYTGFNTVDTIKVPQEVKDAAKEEVIYDDESAAEDSIVTDMFSCINFDTTI